MMAEPLVDETEGASDSVLAAPLPFEDFFDAHRDRLARALAATLGNGALGAEATDEAMSRALARWDTIGGYDDPAGWVYRVGLNWARSWLRRRRHHTDEVLDPAERPAPVDDRVDVSAALAGLDVAHRSVVVLRHLLGYSTAETAEVLGIAEGTVKSRLARALDRLRDDLEVDDA